VIDIHTRSLVSDDPGTLQEWIQPHGPPFCGQDQDFRDRKGGAEKGTGLSLLGRWADESSQSFRMIELS
jgi:hypothetical protein